MAENRGAKSPQQKSNLGRDLPREWRIVMKNVTGTVKSAPRFINATHVQVTKAFAKNAMIFGTPEYKLWREIVADCPAATMVTKDIRKNPNKKTSTKNMTYGNMATYIRTQDDAEAIMLEFEKQIAQSKVQSNPYRFVLAWFVKKFEGYDSYKDYFQQETEQVAKQESLFRLVSPTKAVIEGEELPAASGM